VNKTKAPREGWAELFKKAELENEEESEWIEFALQDGINDLSFEGIEYAIRQNKLEGLETSPESKKLLEDVVKGKLAMDQLREIFDKKAKKYAQKKWIHELSGKEMEKVLANIKKQLN